MEENITVPSPLPIQVGGNGSGDGQEVALTPTDEAPQPAASQSARPGDQATSTNDGIAGMSVLRGLLLYAAVLAFVGLYVDFMVVICTARSGTKPSISAALISAAAALSGVLGSAFALKIGVTPSPSMVNAELATSTPVKRGRKAIRGIRRALSLEPSDTTSKSWPLTFGIWAYAVVGSAVALVYILNQNQTPGAVKALAVTFGGYIIALINVAYSMGKRTT